LSAEKDDAFFAAGIHDDVLTTLGKIKDLKVIGRTSVMAYRQAPVSGRLREIGETLHVSHVLEGSVRRSANRVVINVALLDTRDERQVWSERYERALSDTISLQGELAVQIARALHANLTLAEKTNLATKPTENTDAYVLYLRARELETRFAASEVDYQTAIKLYEQAVDLDPEFGLARARLSIGISRLTQGLDPAQEPKARAEAEEALRLRPNLGEASLAIACCYFFWDKDYDRALFELSRAGELMPSSAEVPFTAAIIYKWQNRFRDRIAALERALTLDPRDPNILNRLYMTFRWLRNWPEALRTRDQVRALLPLNDPEKALSWGRAWDEFRMMGDINSLKKLIAKAPAGVSWEELNVMRYQVAVLERDYPAAERFLSELSAKTFKSFAWKHPKSVEEVALAVARGADRATIEQRAESARQEIEKMLSVPPQFSTRVDELHSNLGLIYAFVGRKEDAIREGRRALELALAPMEKNDASAALALIYARLGESDETIALIERLLTLPAELHPSQMHGMTLTELKWRWQWDPLRSNPRFQKILAGPEPKTAGASSSYAVVPAQSENDKSIAVLPFENLSRDPDTAFFADGIQDEILTDLALIADLKVIGRTSVMQYKSRVARNLRMIGQQLGVAHLVEGSVQRADNRVRVNAQLVDARTERRLWAQTYDRELADVFSIQSDIAKAIAEQLRAKLSPNEKSEIERPPTSEIAAFDLYTRAKDLHLTTSLSSTASADLLRAADLLNDAVERDPSFFQAHCLLAHTHDLLYYFGVDHTPARLALAEAAIEAAFRLRPDSGEAHLARAENLYRGYLDYDGALADLEIAGHTLTNDPRVFELKGYIERRQGRWEEATRDLEHAIDLDPRDAFMVRRMAWQYLFLRRYAEEKAVLERALVIEPNDVTTKVWRASVELHWKADTRPLHQIIELTRATDPAALPAIAERWLICALAERDAIGAKNALIAAAENNPPLADDAVQFTRLFLEGAIARMTKDDNKARAAFTAARAEQEKIVLTQPNWGPALCVLGLIDAGLGRKEDALREARRAVELMPVEKDAIIGALMIEYSAMIAAWVGDKDFACEQLAAAIRLPGPVSYGRLKLLPLWDPLRGNPRFEAIVASLAPKN
jgi:TolB-like protein/Tfp pilus assembly protein PilF